MAPTNALIASSVWARALQRIVNEAMFSTERAVLLWWYSWWDEYDGVSLALITTMRIMSPNVPASKRMRLIRASIGNCSRIPHSRSFGLGSLSEGFDMARAPSSTGSVGRADGRG